MTRSDPQNDISACATYGSTHTYSLGGGSFRPIPNLPMYASDESTPASYLDLRSVHADSIIIHCHLLPDFFTFTLEKHGLV